MKVRGFSKKLNLNKKTIAHLGNEETKKALGGIEHTWGQGSCVTGCYTLYPTEKSIVICCAPYACE